jgi:hypothetical protein
MKQTELKHTAKRILTGAGDAIRGEKVTCQFRKWQKPHITMGNSTHQIQQTRLEGSVFCVIERRMNHIHSHPTGFEKKLEHFA